MKKFIHGIIWGLLRKKSLEEIFFKNGRGPEIIYHSSRQSQHNL